MSLQITRDAIKETQDMKRKIISGEKPEYGSLKVHKIIFEWVKQDISRYKKLVRLSRAVKRGLKNDFDWVCALTGREGVGKSSLLIILGALIDIGFVLEKNLSLLPSSGEIKKMFNRLRRFGVLGLDEAIKALHKQDWYNNIQKALIHMYATERFENKATIMAIPRFNDLNEQFRNHRINCRINVVERGKAMVYVPVDIEYFKDPWFMDEMERRYRGLLKRKKVTELTFEDRVNMEKRNNPSFLDVIEFPDLPPQVKEIYLNLKIEARKKEAEKEISNLPKDQLRKALSIQILREAERSKQQEIADKYNLKKSMVQTLMREGRLWMKENKRALGQGGRLE